MKFIKLVVLVVEAPKTGIINQYLQQGDKMKNIFQVSQKPVFEDKQTSEIKKISKFSQHLINTFGEELYWKNDVLNSHAYGLINRLSGRFTEQHKSDFYNSYPLPGIAITGVMKQIDSMSVQNNGQIGGDYFAFVATLKEEIISSVKDAETKFKNQLLTLSNLLEDTDLDHLKASKEEIKVIYRDFMMFQSSYADAQYEGKALAETLKIHVIIHSVDINGNCTLTQCFGPDQSAIIPTIVLHHTQGDRSAHFVLHQVREDIIPHSIIGDGNCLFSSFAQAMLELYIQDSGFETEVTKAQRKISQKHYGIECGLIPRSSILEDLKSNNDLIRQKTAEILQNYKESLTEEELSMLFNLARHDDFQTVRIATAKIICLKGTESDSLEAQKTIYELLTYSGSDSSNQEEADLVRERAAEAITFLQQNKKINVSDTCIELLRNLARHDAYQIVRIAASEALYINGQAEDCLEAQKIISELVTYSSGGGSTQAGADLVRARAIEALPLIQYLDSTVIEQLKKATQDPSDNVKLAAENTLSQLGQIQDKPWTIAITETGSRYGTNGEVMLAISFHPYELRTHIASHHCLLKYQNTPDINFIQFIQKFISSGTREYPNKSSVAFLQALEYSWMKYYGIPAPSDEAEIITRMFSLENKITPTLSLFNILLSDFIAPDPQGIWSAHKKDYTHFNEMVRCHNKVKDSIEKQTALKHTTVIYTTMQMIVELLYKALGAFKDHELLKEIKFSEEEEKLIEVQKFSTPKAAEQFRNAFLGKAERDIYHVKAALKEGQSTLDTIMIIRMLQTQVTLLPYLQKKGMDCPTELSKYLKGFEEANARYTKAEDAISFLGDLRNMILGEVKGRQLLGIGFYGSFFDAEADSFSDKAAVHLCFSEQYRIVGSVFLEYVGRYLRNFLEKEFKTDIHVCVSMHNDVKEKLMCHYVMDYIWSQVVLSSDKVNDKLDKKISLLINCGLEHIQKTKSIHEHVAAYLNLPTEEMLKKLGELSIAMGQNTPLQNLAVDQTNILKLGKFILNEKMYPCVEVQLIPHLHSGWIFPIILKPIEADHPLVSFALAPFWLYGLEQTKYSFFVAKPCEKFCQPASTAYDIMAEIKSHFAETRGFVGTSFPVWQNKNTIIEFSEIEFSIIKEIVDQNTACFDEHYDAYQLAYEAQKSTSSAPQKSSIVNKKLSNPEINKPDTKGETLLYKAVMGNKIAEVKKLIGEGANINLLTKTQWTPSHFAAMKGYTEVLIELINGGADLSQTDKKGYTPLHLAASYGHEGIVTLLLKTMFPESIIAKDTTGKTARDWASDKGHLDIVNLIEININSVQESAELEVMTLSSNETAILGDVLNNEDSE